MIHPWILAQALSTEKALNKYLLEEGGSNGREAEKEMSETIRFIPEFPDKVTPKCLQLMSLQVPDSKSPEKNYFLNVVRGLQAKTMI